MSYLLDTNVISETIKKKPNVTVIQWLNSTPDDLLFISVLTIGELRKGAEYQKNSIRKEKLRMWLEDEIVNWFNNRMLIIDQAVSEKWGKIQAASKDPLPAIDSLIAATAIHHDLRLVTRNTVDFQYPGLDIINPWNSHIHTHT